MDSNLCHTDLSHSNTQQEQSLYLFSPVGNSMRGKCDGENLTCVKFEDAVAVTVKFEDAVTIR